jgi:tetratricopeptide (TPR) repeat protein
MFRLKQLLRATGLLLTLTALTTMSVPAFAAEEKKREAPQVDAATGKRLNEAIEAVNAEKYTEAKVALSKLNPERLSPYELSRVEQMYASIASSENNYPEASRRLQAAIATGGMSDDEILAARYQIAQLFMVQEKWKEGAAALKQWFATAPSPNSGAYYLLAIAYYRMDDHRNAVEPAQKAVDMAEKPQANWIELLLALRIEREEYAKALPLLKHLVQIAPEKRNNWMQLSAIYRQMEKYDEALAVTQIAYMAGHITSESDLKALADLQAFTGVPFRAANLLENKIKGGAIQADGKTWEKVSYMWIASRDYKRALPPLGKAAAMHGTGDLYVRMAEIELRNENWDAAESALTKAIQKGNLKNPGNSHLLLGITLFEKKQASKARAAFQKAAQFGNVAQQARTWIAHIDSTSSS